MGFSNIKKEAYEPKKVELINLMLQNAVKLNQPRLYEIYVNDLLVVSKTDDLSQFESFQEFIDEETNLVKFFVYRYHQTNADKFFLYITPESLAEAKSQELSGVVAKTKTESVLKEQWEKDKHYEALKEENAALRAQSNIDDKALAKAAKENRMIRERMDVKFKDRVSMFLDGVAQSEFVKKNFAGVDVIKDLFKNEPEENLSGEEQPPESDEDYEEIHQRVLTIEEEKHLLLLKDIKAKVGTTHLASIMYLLDLFASNPNSIDSAIKVVKNYIAQKPRIIPEAETEIN